MLALYASAGALAAGLFIGWSARDWKADADEADRLRQANADLVRNTNRVDRASTGFEHNRAEADAREVRIAPEIRRVLEKPSYAAECLDADGLRILAADIEASNARRELAPALPAASAPR